MTATLIAAGSNTSNNATIAIATTVAVAAGETIVAIVAAMNGSTHIPTSMTDSAGNTYTRDTFAGGTARIAIFSCLNPVPLSSGLNITCTIAVADTRKVLVAWKLPFKATDKTTGTGSGTSNAPAATTVASAPVGAEALGGSTILGLATHTPNAAWGEDRDQQITNTATMAHRLAATVGAGTVQYLTGASISAAWGALVGAYWVAAPPAEPPRFTSPPSVPSGVPMVGVEITGTAGVVAGDAPITVTRQWYRGGSTLISGATSLSYTPQQADVGATLKMRESATNVAGGPVTSDSNETDVVVAAPPVDFMHYQPLRRT